MTRRQFIMAIGGAAAASSFCNRQIAIAIVLAWTSVATAQPSMVHSSPEAYAGWSGGTLVPARQGVK